MTPLDILRRAGPPAPPEPSPPVLAAASNLVADEATSTLLHIRGAWHQARGLVSSAQRRVRRSVGSRDRRLLGDLLYALIRGDRLIGLALEQAGLPPNPDPAQAARARVLTGLCLYFGLPPERAAAAWSGPALNWAAFASTQDLLLGWAESEQPTPAQALGAAASLPDWLAALLIEDHGEAAPELARALNCRAPICLRTLGPAADRDLLEIALRQQGLAVEATALSPHGLRIEGRSNVHELREVRAGQLFVQDEGSQLVAELCAPKPGHCVVDACAGAGGKTLALASLMTDRGQVLATDIRDKALREARGRAKAARLHCIRTVPLVEDEASLPPALAQQIGRADRVLVDAPCTGTGALRRRPGARWQLSPLDLDRLPDVQNSILERMAPLVAEGGRLIYATCSVLQRENEAVIEVFLSRNPSFRLLPVAEVLGAARGKEIGDGRVLRLLPQVHGTDGFFAAVLERTEPG